jgi:cobyrinic acid a,c-diamide synthase
VSLRLHGDTIATDDAIDFAVNVWPADREPQLQKALERTLSDDRYPDEREARAAVAARHGRDPDEVLLTNGACEAFWLLAHTLRPARATCIHPGFTEPEAALLAVGSTVTRVFRVPDDWRFDASEIPPDTELVVLGNPDNPTGALESADSVAALARPGRFVLVDESFMDFVPGEAGSLASRRDPGVIVVRSLTKLWSLAGIRAGYVLGPAELVRRLEGQRQPWSVNALACAALATCARDRETPARIAGEVATARDALVAGLARLEIVDRVWPSAANFVLARVHDGPRVIAELRGLGIAVRPAESFPGLGPDHLRVAVRTPAENELLLAALEQVTR